MLLYLSGKDVACVHRCYIDMYLVEVIYCMCIDKYLNFKVYVAEKLPARDVIKKDTRGGSFAPLRFQHLPDSRSPAVTFLHLQQRPRFSRLLSVAIPGRSSPMITQLFINEVSKGRS